MIHGLDYGGSHPEDRQFTNVKIACMPLCEEGDCQEIGVLWVLVPSYTWRHAMGVRPIGERNVPLCEEHFIEFLWP